MRNRFLVLAIAAILVVGVPQRASAHDLRGTVKLLADAVLVEAEFGDGTPAEGAHVVILDGAGNAVARGQTDERGVCRLPKLGPGSYQAIVESIGHRDTVVFEVAGTAGDFQFSNWRLDTRVGLALGLGALLVLTAAFWWFRLRKSAE